MHRLFVSFFSIAGLLLGAGLAGSFLWAGAQQIEEPGSQDEFGSGETDPVFSAFEQANLPVELAVGLRQLGEGALGDTISPETGSLTFRHVDVALPTNSGLPLEFARIHTLDGVDYQRTLGGWTVDLPYVTARVATARGWPDRCTGVSTRPDIAGDSYIDDDAWTGARMFIPGQGGRLILEEISSIPGASQLWNNDIPQRATEDHWRIDCLNSLQQGEGEGFVATSPSGTKYIFDWMIIADASLLPVGGGGCPNQLCELDPDANIETAHYNIYATRIEDVNGNWIEFEYGSSGIERIHSNDLQEITVQRAPSSSRIESVSANGRTWTYEIQNGQLYRVHLPDTTFWEFDLKKQSVFPVGYPCGDGGALGNNSFFARTETVKHPNGIIGTFDVTLRKFGRNNVPDTPRPGPITPASFDFDTCNDFDIPAQNISLAVISKTLNVPIETGTQTQTWTYEYQQDDGFRMDGNNEASSDNDLRKSTITDPTGAYTEFYHNRRFNDFKEGKLIKTVRYSSGGIPLQTTEYQYLQGEDMGSDSLAITRLAPKVYGIYQSRTDTTYDVEGDSYTTISEFETDPSEPGYSFGQPIRVTQVSSLQPQSRETVTTYTSRKTPWVVGLPDRVTRNGVEFSRNFYDSLGRPTEIRRFGIKAADFTYHPAGTQGGQVATITDIIGRSVSLTNYKAGTAQDITRPDGVTLHRNVDDNGWVTSHTDARGNTTSYQYDAMGRLTQITRPGALLPTSVSYPLLDSGITQEATTGSVRSTTFYDGMLRPYLSKQEALSGGGDTIYTRTGFDTLSRTVFSSFPSETATASAGTNTFYDDLSRPIRSEETVVDPETGAAVQTFTNYLSNNTIETIDPEGNATRTIRSGYGSPEDGNPLRIDQFQGAGGSALISTLMSYDIYGNLLTATQDGITQSWQYDNRYRLCAHTTPETGTTRYEYDDANQMIAYAEAQSAGCGVLSSANRIVNSYDNLGRLTLRDYPVGTEDVSMAYDLDNNLVSNTRGTAVWTYTHDANNLMLSETLDIDGRTYSSGYTYNGNGFMTAMTSPGGRNFTYNIDGFGRPTRVRENGVNRAGGARYYANGQLEYLNYGNGFAYRTTQTPRLQTSRAWVRRDGTSTYVTDFTYDYDLNGRINSISDGVDANESRSFLYDGVNRLTSADGPWGNVAYTYDARNNLRTKTFSDGRFVQMFVNSQNRVFRFNDTLTTGGVNRNLGYDDRGNVRNNSRQVFEYDLANQPLTTRNQGVTSTFVYDGNYKRVKQTINGETIYSVYSIDGTLNLRDNITTGEVTDYVRLGSKTIAELQNGVPTYLYPDHLGTPVAGADQNRNILWRDSRTPFGEKINPVAARENRVGYTGHIEDDALKLTYMQARYYDPVIGRFMSNDPVGFASGGVGYFNRYAYTLNDPINLYDPDGQAATVAAPIVRAVVKRATAAAVRQGIGSGSNIGSQSINSAHSVESAHAAAVMFGASTMVVPGDAEDLADGLGELLGMLGIGSNSASNQQTGDGTIGTDSTGKVHGDLPNVDDIDNDDLERADEVLGKSIETRSRENEGFPRGNPNGNDEERRDFEKFQQHKDRISDEQRLREQVRSRLRDQ